MSLKKYLGVEKIELLKYKIESSMGIQLKILPPQLISENQLREQEETGNQKGFVIVITVKAKTEAKKLYVSGLCFDKLIRVMEKYWEARQSSVCITCYDIGHK